MANLITQAQITDSTLADHLPQQWLTVLPESSTTILQFNNIHHFKNTVSLVTQLKDDKCDITYNQALAELKANKGTMSSKDYQVIKDKVRSALLKRNLISEDIYQGFEYTTEGELIDIARFIEGNPECVITPKTAGKNHFYEIHINTSIPWNVTDREVQNKLARILATIELLESQKIYIKVNAVFSAENVNNGSGKENLLITMPIFSHRDGKSIDALSSVVNVRLLRKFGFAIFGDLYGKDIAGGYGRPVKLPHTINLMDNFDECEVAADILDKLVIPCKKRVL